MIEEVKDFFGDVKDTVGDKGFLILIVGVIAFFVYNLLKSDNASGDVYYNPSGVVSYPDVGKNADVVIDSVNNTIESYYNEMLNVMDETKQTISGGTTSIMGALSDTESNIMDGISDSTENIMGGIKDAEHNVIDNMVNTKDEIVNDMGVGFDSVHLGFEKVENYINESMAKVEDLSSKVDNLETKPKVQYVTQYVPQYTPTVGTTETVNKKDTTTNVSPDKQADTYDYKTKAGLNTSTSIVDALKATGVDSSMSNRKKIAQANGIENYTGTYSQNVAMLNKLKDGSLVKPDGATSTANSKPTKAEIDKLSEAWFAFKNSDSGVVNANGGKV